MERRNLLKKRYERVWEKIDFSILEGCDIDVSEQLDKLKARIAAERVHKKIPNKMQKVERLTEIAKDISELYKIDIDIDATDHSFVFTFYLEYMMIMDQLKSGLTAFFYASDDVLINTYEKGSLYNCAMIFTVETYELHSANSTVCLD